MSAIHLGTVAEVLARGDAGGFFAGVGEALLLGLSSILLALCIAFIPMIARRIVQGNMGSTMFAVMSAVVTAATLGATAAMNGLGYAISHGSGGGDSGNQPPGGGGGGGRGQGSSKNTTSAADQSSQQAPKPPEDKTLEGTKGADASTSGSTNGGRPSEGAKSAETVNANADTAIAAAKESTSAAQGGDGGSGRSRGNQNRPSPFNARIYTPLSLTAIATAEAGMLLGTAYRKTANALRSKGSAGEEDNG